MGKINIDPEIRRERLKMLEEMTLLGPEVMWHGICANTLANIFTGENENL